MADIFPKMSPGNMGPQSTMYMPESTHELDFQLFKIDKTIFKNPEIARILTDDAVRSYLNDNQIKALYHLASAYVAFVNASQGEYKGAFSDVAEMVLADILFLVNIARSRKGANISTIKGRPVNRDLFPAEIPQGWLKNPLPQQQQPQQQQPMAQQFYTEDYRRQ